MSVKPNDLAQQLWKNQFISFISGWQQQINV
jgi:hypothetical protein